MHTERVEKIPRSVIATIVLALSAGIIGFALGRYNAPQINQTLAPSTREEQPKTSPLFRSQTATFQGEITKVSGNKLSVKDDKGQTGDFPVSNKVVIYKFKAGSNQASASSDLKSIDIGKQALVILELVNGKYQVTSISYLPPPPKS